MTTENSVFQLWEGSLMKLEFILEFIVQLKAYGLSPATEIRTKTAYYNYVPYRKEVLKCDSGDKDSDVAFAGSLVPSEVILKTVRVRTPLRRYSLPIPDGSPELGGAIAFCVTYRVTGSSEIHHFSKSICSRQTKVSDAGFKSCRLSGCSVYN